MNNGEKISKVSIRYIDENGNIQRIVCWWHKLENWTIKYIDIFDSTTREDKYVEILSIKKD